MRWLFIFLFLCAASIAYPQGDPKPNKKPAAKEQQGTDKNPISVKVFPAQDAEAEARKREEFRKRDAYWSDRVLGEHRIGTATWALFWVTFVLAGFTAALWWATYRLSRDAKEAGKRQATETAEALKISSDAAKASKDSADAAKNEFISTHRPKIRVRHVWAVGELEGNKSVSATIQIVNAGITSAKIIEWSAVLRLIPSDKELPPIPYYGHKVIVGNDPFLQSGHSTDLPPAKEVEQFQILDVSHDDNTAIRNGTKRLFCIGYVVYQDAANRPRTTAFGRVLIPPTGVGSLSEIGRFSALNPPNPDYEYQD